MGVTNLWQILEPVKQPVNLSSLRGKTLAVDLSLWVCEAQTVKKMIGVVTKPHLRNLFFRFSFLTSMGIKLVFVMEGEAPELKADTMSKRNEMRYGTSKQPRAARTGRSYFKSALKECLELLECLGVPWVQAAGEAEAMCAYLNANGHVDGCITNDGDVFLYGAQTVYRNFAMNAKEPHLDCYTMSAIKKKLGCDRESLIGLAILLGCDYLPKGIPGVGKEQALKLIETLQGQNLLQRFAQWGEQFRYNNINPPLVVKKVTHCSECHHPGSYKEHEHNGCKFCESVMYCKPHDSKYCCPCEWHQLEREKQASAVEDNIRKRANSCDGFPFSEVIQEFLVNKNKLNKIMECQRPSLLSFQRFAFEKMEWTKHYACKKLLVLLTRYDMIQRKSGYTDSKQLQAIRIIKTRVKNGTPCFEIQWQKPEHYVDADDQPVELFVVTVEEESLFQAAYPDVVALYQMEKSEILEKKQKSRKNRPKEKELSNVYGEVTDLMSQMNLKSTCEILPVQDSMSDIKILPEDQIHQRSIESKDPALAAASCITTVQMPVSAAALSPTVSAYLLLQSTLADSSVSPAQLTKNSELSSSCTTSVPADLQLSSADWEGASFSISPALGNDTLDLVADLATCMQHSYPLHHKTVINSSEYSGAMQSDQDHSDSADDLFSDDTMGQLQKLSLSERILMKTSVQSKSSLSEDVMELKPLKCFKITKGTLNPDKDYVSSSYQLNKTVQETKNVLSENYVRESSVHIYQDRYKNANSLAQTVQKHHKTNSSTFLALSSQTVKPLQPGCEILPLSQKPADVVTGCHITETCTQATWKTLFKRSVCQNKCSSSEDSDDGNVNKNLISEQQKRQLNPGHFKKKITKKKSNAVTSKRMNSDSAIAIKEEEKKTNFKITGNNLSVQVSPKPSPVMEDNCLSPEQPSERSGSCSLQQAKSDILTYALADSPLPLSERLKGRLKSN
ncbi:flap endonuclease GEN homolog 1 isoform X1 [Apteryx rowi]|uniref:flap endonuclease GEN homolog 1 isoform X1 n=2 Tax=Apteryx rowi TaxID=308060 RepID=UPI000E1C5F43|nr:flap endonuclease GEN homolog 1 isoform X1 [Apteryx rowi]XP_025944606.1 flap endonuclease GEN homolog 1 isoform X1 [Apteryx rowi]XP_025944607.1 flap endonuclease GEN homolog 1 isoform X1 [Apteryx rowi]XP_025944608.1 flap endonuclease GEN homolog 1 isoform X1 [Apteryx rowi]XP_025944609.1 flap endonuclease GEN homolog 1 isoform X1 [Apteryx rowi]